MPNLSSFEKIEQHDTAIFEVPEVPDESGVPYFKVRLCDRSNSSLYKRYIPIIQKLTKGRRNLKTAEAVDIEEQAFLEFLPKYAIVEWGTINGKMNPEPLNKAEIGEWLSQLREHLPDVYRRLVDFCQRPSNFRDTLMDEEEVAELGED